MPFPFWPRRRPPAPSRPISSHMTPPETEQSPNAGPHMPNIRRHFYNEPGFQCYASFFTLWNGWATAGHCLTEAAGLIPPFIPDQTVVNWPGGLDAALIGCSLPDKRPSPPIIGQRVSVHGYPAGCRTLEIRHGHIYIERGTGSGTWIVHIEDPDEPVVTGMSGGPVIDRDSGLPIGILITRNSPADLNCDRDPDESCDFIALSAIWDFMKNAQDIA